MQNCEFNKYGFVENNDFVGLIPKVMDILGDDYCVGGSDEIVSIYDPTANGVDQLKIVSSQKIAESEEE